MNYRERLNAGLYSPDENVRAKAERVLAKAYKARLAEGEAEADAEELNEVKVEAAEKS